MSSPVFDKRVNRNASVPPRDLPRALGGLCVTGAEGTANLMGNDIKERSRIAVLTRLAAVLVLIWSVIGIAPAASHAGPRVVADWPIIDARCAPITPQGLVNYGCHKLSTYLQEARLDLRYNRPPKTTDKLYTNVRGNYAIAQLQDGKYIIGYSDGAKHAEIRLIEQMQGKAPRIEFDPKTGKVSYQPAKASPIKEDTPRSSPARRPATRRWRTRRSGTSSPTATGGTLRRARTKRFCGIGPTTATRVRSRSRSRRCSTRRRPRVPSFRSRPRSWPRAARSARQPASRWGRSGPVASTSRRSSCAM